MSKKPPLYLLHDLDWLEATIKENVARVNTKHSALLRVERLRGWITKERKDASRGTRPKPQGS